MLLLPRSLAALSPIGSGMVLVPKIPAEQQIGSAVPKMNPSEQQIGSAVPKIPTEHRHDHPPTTHYSDLDAAALYLLANTAPTLRYHVGKSRPDPPPRPRAS